MKRALLWLAGFASLAALALAAVIYSGIYDISAINQHLPPTYDLIDLAKRRSVELRARNLVVPPLDDPAAIERGMGLFAQHCVHCHGAPGTAPAPYALSMTPTPANLVYTARTWSPAGLFLVIRDGIKMTGMPAWAFRLEEAQVWDVVAFMVTLPGLEPARYAEKISALGMVQPPPPVMWADLDVERGRLALGQYGCVTCHRIPGVVGANAPVGPPLDGIGNRSFIAGTLPNTPANMQRWLRYPQRINPHSAMPDLEVGERDARDMAAYLGTLRRPRSEVPAPVPPRLD